MTRNRAILSAVTIGIWAVTAPGCRSPFDASLQDLLVGELVAESPPDVSLEQVMPFIAGESGSGDRFAILEGGGRGSVLLITRASLDDDAWSETLRVEGEPEPLEQRLLSLDPGGDLRLELIVKHDRGLQVEMDPPPIIQPLTLRAGEPVESSFAMRLPLLSNPEQLRASGTGATTIELLGSQTIRGPRGRVEAIVIREIFTTDLNLSRSRRETRRWIVPGEGLVLERWEEVVRVMGIVPTRSVRTIHLLPEE